MYNDVQVHSVLNMGNTKFCIPYFSSLFVLELCILDLLKEHWNEFIYVFLMYTLGKYMTFYCFSILIFQI